MVFPFARIAITRIHPEAKLPHKGTPESIGADVYAYIKSDRGHPLKAVIPPGTTRLISTGIVAVAEPPYSILVCSRSGMAKDRTIFVTNSPGVVDPDYRGEIKVLLHNGGADNQWISDGDRIAQLILVPIPIPEIIESGLDLRKLSSTRGEAGFGSTGQ
jgi:dUTP pyrophosphatase